jgi:hypothetical protein
MSFQLPDLSSAVNLTEWYKDTMPELPGIQADIVLHHIRNTVIQMCEESRILTTEVSDSLTQDVFEHSILDAADGNTEIAAIVTVRRDGVALTPTSEIELDETGDWASHTGTPSKWFRSAFDVIQLYPIPDYDDPSSPLAAGYGPSDTAFELADASEFPELSDHQFFIAGVTDSNGDREAVRVTATDDNDFYVIRAQEGTTALTFLTGDLLRQMTLRAKIALRPTLDATQVDSNFFKEYRIQVAQGVKAALMLMPGKPWSNPTMGAYYQLLFDNGKVGARVSALKSKGNQRLRVKSRTFGY